jgi:hypothetical protein
MRYKGKAPKPVDIIRARTAIDNLARRYGNKHYKKRRKKVSRIVEEALTKYEIRNTISENYWRLALTCQLIGL